MKLMADKSDHRRAMLARRRSLPAAEIQRASKEVCHRLQVLPEVMIAPILALYAAFAGEIDLTELFATCKRQGKEILLPRFNRTAGCYEMVLIRDFWKDTAIGYYGIREPLPRYSSLARSQLGTPEIAWVVPGLAFDDDGSRLGHGRGHYDRLLDGTQGCKIGVGYDWQLTEKLPLAAHDVRMDVVVTESREIRQHDLCAEEVSSPAVAC
jgi:5-formyltetrahydrofolate cyclo-ligase